MQFADGRRGPNYAYTLGLAGNRLTVAELSGRSVAYGHDSLYRLTSENVTADPNNHNGTTSYLYDPVGNRQQLLANGVTANSYTYDADDRLGSDSYDAEGNTINSLGTASTYDFENHMVQNGCALITARARPSTSVPVFVTLFRFLGKQNDPVDRLRSEMICRL